MKAPQRTTTQAAKLEFLVITPNSSAVFAIGVAFEKPTFKRADKTPQTIAIVIPLVIFELLELVKFCNLSKKIAQDSGLSSNKFNSITEKAQKDTTLRKRIQNAMIRARLP